MLFAPNNGFSETDFAKFAPNGLGVAKGTGVNVNSGAELAASVPLSVSLSMPWFNFKGEEIKTGISYLRRGFGICW